MIDYALTDSVQIASVSPGFSGASYAAPTTYPCRYQDRLQTITDARGEQVMSDAIVFLPPGTNVKVADRVVFGGENYHVQRVVRRRALDYEEHVQIWLGRGG